VLNVKSAAQFSPAFLLLVAIAWTGTWSASPAQTQTQAQAQTRPDPRAAQPRVSTAQRTVSVPGTAVAVVDISFIFENHVGFKHAMEQMKKEVQQYEQELQQRNQELQKDREQLGQYNPGSQEYEKLERAIADKAAKLQIDMQMKKREFLQRESRVYYDVYQEVAGAVREFAQLKGIDLVLRYSDGEMKPEDRGSVLQGVNRAILYQSNLDITREILDRLNRTPQVSRNPAAGRPAPRATR
jgi:Skp family chaperone for outer membrane proteins